jgi:hypothetical protein
MCDILGFKNIIAKTPIDQVLDYFRRGLGGALYRCIHHEEPPDDLPSLHDLQSQTRVGFAWFSDTLLFYSLQDDLESRRNVVETLGWLFGQQLLISSEWRLRGGVAYGEFYADPTNAIYVGQALVDAYSLEKVQDWAGAALNPAAESVLPSGVGQGPGYPWYLRRYDVPVKRHLYGSDPRMIGCSGLRKYGYKTEQRTESLLAIDWTMVLHHPWQLSQNCEDPPIGTAEGIARKFFNTRRFHRSVCTFCRTI